MLDKLKKNIENNVMKKREIKYTPAKPNGLKYNTSTKTSESVAKRSTIIWFRTAIILFIKYILY